MANSDPTNMRVGSSGKAYTAPLGTVAPVGIRTYTAGPPAAYTPITWGAAWVDLGLISDDGLNEGMDSDREEWTPWGYSAPARTQITKENTTFKFTAWETNADVLSLRYRIPKASMTTLANNTEVSFSQVQNIAPDVRAFGFDVIDGSNQFRYVIGRGEVTDRGDVANKQNEMVGYDFTVTAYPDSTGVSIKRFYLAGLSLT